MGLVFVRSLVDLSSNLLLEVRCFTCSSPRSCCTNTCSFVFFAEALTRLNVIIRHPNALHSDNVMAYDNAVSALGKICQFYRESIDATQVHSILLWLVSAAPSSVSSVIY
jgi:hypothetical protein